MNRMDNFKQKLRLVGTTKKGIACIAVTIAALAFLITAIVLSVLLPSGRALAPAEGRYTDVTRVHERVYLADSNGNLARADGEGNVLYSAPVAAEGSYIFETLCDENCDYLFCKDNENRITVVRDTGEQIQIVCRSAGSIVLEEVLSDGQYIYLVKQTGKALTIEKHAISRFEEGFPTLSDALAGGTLYEMSVRAGNITLAQSNNPRPVGYAIEGNYLFVFCAAGRIFRMNTDLAGLEKVGRLMEEGETSVPEAELDKDDYFVYGSTLSICGAEYHRGLNAFYLLDSYANIYSFSSTVFDYSKSERGVLNFSEYVKSTLSFKSGYGPINKNNDASSSRDTPPMVLEEDANLLLVFFTSSNRIAGFDVENGMRARFDANFEYNVRSVACGDGGALFLIYAGQDNVTTNLSLNSPSIYLRTTFLALAIVFFVLAAAAIVTAILLFMSITVEGFGKKVKDVLKDFVKQKWVYLILLFSIVLLCLFCYYPAVSSILLSFTDYTGVNPSKQWNNFGNYIRIFTDTAALRSFGNMFIFLAVDIVTSIVPPLIFAFFLSILRAKAYTKTARVLLFLPGILPSMATALIWKFGIFGSNGVLNGLVRLFAGDPDLTINFLFNDKTSLPSLIFMGFPWVGQYLIFYGAMMNIPSSYFEAAELEGCGIFKRFFLIDIPLITAQIKYVFIMSFIASVQNFGRVYTLTGGAYGTDIPINRMYGYLLAQDYGLAAAYATILFLFLLVATVLNLRMQTVEHE